MALAQQRAGPDPGVLAVPVGDLAGDDDRVDAAAELPGTLEGRGIGDGIRREQHQVGDVAGNDRAPAVQVQPAGRLVIFRTASVSVSTPASRA